MKKFISIYNLDFLELSGSELKVILFMLWHRNNYMANKQFASSKKIANAIGCSQRSVFDTLKGLEEKKWIERLDGDYYIHASSMSLMIDNKNASIDNKTFDRTKKEYLLNPEIIDAFVKMYPSKNVSKILDTIITTVPSKKIYNYHEYAKRILENSKDKKEKIKKQSGWWNN